MTHPPRVAVVGAGVVGLATGAALIESGADVRIYDRDPPGQGQSKGRTRIFRLAHGDSRLVDLAARSQHLWSAWETSFRRRLVSHEGLIVTGDNTVASWSSAMSDAGAPHSVLTIEEAISRLPAARPDGSAALFDPSGGPTRARRTIECLVAACHASLRQEEVLQIERAHGACTVSTARSHWECDEIVIAAGTETGRLGRMVGIGVETSIVHASRLTYSIDPVYRDRSLACWIDSGGTYQPGYTSYGQRVGSTDLYAVGVSWGDTQGLDSERQRLMHRERAASYIRAAYPGLHPEPVDEIQCSYAVRGLREDGDGFMARRTDGVTALYGNNLFKFAPLLGELLCQTALSGVLAAELDFDEETITST